MTKKEELIPDGAIARWHRYEKGWTQEDLARRAGLNKKTIENVEDGKPARPTTLTKVAQALGVPVDGLLRTPTRSTARASSADLVDRIKRLEDRQHDFEIYIRAEELLKNPLRLDDAEFFYRQLLSRNPRGEHAENAYIGIAKVHRRRLNYREAISTLNELLARYPNNARGYYNRACYLNLSGGRKKEVFEDLKKSIREAGDHGSSYRSYARKDEDLHNLWRDEDFQTITGKPPPPG